MHNILCMAILCYRYTFKKEPGQSYVDATFTVCP